MKKSLTKKLFLLVDKLFYKTQNPPKKTAEAMRGLTHLEDIAFGEEEREKLDLLYLPRPKGEKYPVVFEIHGGGFSAGDKRYRLYHCAQIAKRTGAMVVNVNHPLGPENTCPKPLQSLVRAFNWVVDHAEEYDLDLSRMLVTGDSSGAYYAAFLAVIPDDPCLQKIYGEMKGRFSHAVYLCGIYDMAASIRRPLPFGVTKGVCYDITGRKPKELSSWEYFPYFSPIEFVTDRHPETLVVYAKKDFFARGQAESLVEKLREKGVRCEEYHSTRFLHNHAFVLNMDNKVAREAREKTFSFIEEFCKSK